MARARVVADAVGGVFGAVTGAVVGLEDAEPLRERGWATAGFVEGEGRRGGAEELGDGLPERATGVEGDDLDGTGGAGRPVVDSSAGAGVTGGRVLTVGRRGIEEDANAAAEALDIGGFAAFAGACGGLYDTGPPTNVGSLRVLAWASGYTAAAAGTATGRRPIPASEDSLLPSSSLFEFSVRPESFRLRPPRS